MIQRIQSLYIFLVVVLMSLCSFLPLLEVMGHNGELYTTLASGIVQDGETILATTPLFILTLSIVFINLVALLAFRKRMIQIRLLIFSIVLQIGTYVMGGYYLLQIGKDIDAVSSPNIAVTFPLIACVLSFLAIRAIGKDEALVRSLDRIR